MGDAAFWRLQAVRALYAVAVLAIIVVLLLPIGSGGARFPGPDIILVLTIAWTIRAPNQLPAVLVGAVLLVADLVLMRPPGLMAAITIVGVEFIRARQSTWRGLNLPAEWAIGGAVVAAILITNALAHTIFLVPQPPLGQTVIRLLISVLVYPIMVAVVLYVFKIESAAIKGNTAGTQL